jgi:hypothetical protein
VAHDLQGDVLVLVGDGLQEEQVQVFLQRQVDHGLGRVLAALPGDLGHGAMGPLHRVEHEEPVVIGRPRLGAQGAPVIARARALYEATSQVGVAQAPPLLVEGQGAELLPHR